MTDTSVKSMNNSIYNNTTEDERIEWFFDTEHHSFRNGIETELVGTSNLVPLNHEGNKVVSYWSEIPSFDENTVSDIIIKSKNLLHLYRYGHRGPIELRRVKLISIRKCRPNEVVADWLKRLLAKCGPGEYIRMSGWVLQYDADTDEFVSGDERFESDRFYYDSENDEGEEIVIDGEGVVAFDKVKIVNFDFSLLRK